MFQFPPCSPEGRAPLGGTVLPVPGFPIQRSSDRSSLPAPRGLSQVVASFFVCKSQGIHCTPLKNLTSQVKSAYKRWRLSASKDLHFGLIFSNIASRRQRQSSLHSATLTERTCFCNIQFSKSKGLRGADPSKPDRRHTPTDNLVRSI